MKSLSKTYLQFLFVAPLIFYACSDDDGLANTCDVGNPAVELDWLAFEIQTLEQSVNSRFHYLSQAAYEGETVFFFQNCNPNALSVIPTLHNCEGDSVGALDFGNDGIDRSALTNESIIWRPSDYVCTK